MSLRTCIRLVISTLLGVVAGLFIFVLAPSPHESVVPYLEDARKRDLAVTIAAVSSDGRYVVTEAGVMSDIQAAAGKESTIDVWNQQRGQREPLITAKISPGEKFLGLLFSPDEEQMAIIRWDWQWGKTLVTIYHLPDKEPRNYAMLQLRKLFFDPDGRLLAASDAGLCDVESGREIKKLESKKNDDFVYRETVGEYALFATENEIRVYSWLSGELCASGELLTDNFIDEISHDGKAIAWSEAPMRAGPFSGEPSGIMNFTTARKYLPKDQYQLLWRMSPDGRHLAYLDSTKPIPWLAKWNIGKARPCIRIIDWSSETEGETILNASQLRFSPKGNRVAILRDDQVVEIYEFPLRRPWRVVFVAGFLVAFGVWGLICVWSRLLKSPIWRR